MLLTISVLTASFLTKSFCWRAICASSSINLAEEEDNRNDWRESADTVDVVVCAVELLPYFV
jgi:hypothetical protein